VKELLETITRALVDTPEAVHVHSMEGANGRVLYEIQVDPKDIGKVIGREGRIIKSIRVLAKACAVRDGKNVQVELAE